MKTYRPTIGSTVLNITLANETVAGSVSRIHKDHYKVVVNSYTAIWVEGKNLVPSRTNDNSWSLVESRSWSRLEPSKQSQDAKQKTMYKVTAFYRSGNPKVYNVLAYSEAQALLIAKTKLAKELKVLTNVVVQYYKINPTHIKAQEMEKETAKTVKSYTATGGFYCSRAVTDKASVDWLNSLKDRIVEFFYLDEAKVSLDGEYHCTIIYSKNTLPKSLLVSRNSIQVSTVDCTLLGHPDADTLVLSLMKSSIINNDYRKWVSLGASSDYPNYIPHVSLLKLNGYSVELREAIVSYLNDLLTDDTKGGLVKLQLDAEQVEDIKL